MRNLLTFFVALALFGCGTETGTTLTVVNTPGSTPSRGVTTGGAQDIAAFRRVVARGGVPDVGVLDPVGFFAEHAIDLPPADCGDAVCVHPMLAVAPRFNGENWTMAYVAMNSSVDPSAIERPPLHLVIALENSLYSAGPYTAARLAAADLAESLRPEDRVSVFTFGDATQILTELSEPSTGIAFPTQEPSQTDISLFDAVYAAGELARTEFEGTSRVLMLASGQNTAGIRSTERLVDLASDYGKDGIAFSMVGMGDVNVETLSAIGDLGMGTYAISESAEDLVQILEAESATSFLPLATDFRLRLVASEGYELGEVVGARRAKSSGGSVTFDAPALFLGHRTGSSDTSTGRRGGGGGMFVSLHATGEGPMASGLPAFSVSGSYQGAEAPVDFEQTVVNSLAPGENPEDMWPEFSAPEQGKVFMMLNMYLGLRAAVTFYDQGDCGHALGTVDMLARSVEAWQAEFDDVDIDADFMLLLDLRDNMKTGCEASRGEVPVVEPINHQLGCMGV